MLAEGARAGCLRSTGRLAGWSHGCGPARRDWARRSRLDPMLHAAAATNFRVRVMLGTTADRAARRRRHVHVLLRLLRRLQTESTAPVGARLVVGADGTASAVARLAGAREDVADNQRFPLPGLLPRGRAARPRERADLAAGRPRRGRDPHRRRLTSLGAFPTKEHLAKFRADRVAALESFLARVPDGPDLSSPNVSPR
ncbi:hypothetical protein HBB16_19555 [Pseudonocardia sp. MCCB 268]|nr:hypothetical protein [Pseudonocardia cytotoxica]